jgi:DNA-binding transcriptional LysR family regulator
MDGAEIELRELRYFIAVAEELNFTRAAARLGLAQPPLSAAIGKLERKLGVRLLERTSRRVALTPAGAVLLEQGRIAVEVAGAALERARRAGTQASRLSVAIKPGTGTELLRKIIQRCARDPLVPEVHLLFGHPGGPAAAVRRGAADVAILRAPFDRRGLDTEPLLTEPRVAVLPAHHRLAGRAELRRADLAGEPMPRWAGQADPAVAAYWTGAGDPGAERPPGPEINDISQLLDAVTLGGAVAYVPVSLAVQHRSADLVFVPVSDLPPSEVVVAWPEASRSRAVAGFVRAAVEVAASAVADTRSWTVADSSLSSLVSELNQPVAGSDCPAVSWANAVHQARPLVRPAGQGRRRAGHRPGHLQRRGRGPGRSQRGAGHP